MQSPLRARIVANRDDQARLQRQELGSLNACAVRPAPRVADDDRRIVAGDVVQLPVADRPWAITLDP
jgi:hypothetical protein